MKSDNSPLPVNEAMLIEMLSGIRTFCVRLAGPQPVYSAFCAIAEAKPPSVPVTSEDRDIGYADIDKHALGGILTAILVPAVCAKGPGFALETLKGMISAFGTISALASAVKHDYPDCYPPNTLS